MKVTTTISLFAAALSIQAGPSTAAGSGEHNGTWAVELVTDSGVCRAHYTYAVTIQDGSVRLASGAADVSGRIASDGTVGLAVSNGTATGIGSGRLSAGRGSGTWSVSSLCSGHWTARRGDSRTAQAE